MKSAGMKDEISLLALVNFVLRYRRLLVAVPAVMVAAVVLYSVLQPRTYSASASFQPQSPDMSRAGLSGLAAQIGVSIPGGPAGESPAFYVDLLQTRQILGSTVDTWYAFSVGQDSVTGTLVDLFDVRGSMLPERRENAIRKLRESLTVISRKEAGIVTLTVEAEGPELARQIATRMLQLVNEFNLHNRQSRAAAERRFVEDRVAMAQSELNSAERRLKVFLERNRQFRNSPELSFEHERLQRDVVMRQQVYSSLAQAYEQARIDEVRDIPVITIVEQPTLPVRPNGRGTVARSILALLVGSVVGVGIALAREVSRRNREESPPEFLEFVTLRGQAVQDLRRPWRALVSRSDGSRRGSGVVPSS
jgi:tyrosine-protein kinase Etk/Wzc